MNSKTLNVVLIVIVLLVAGVWTGLINVEIPRGLASGTSIEVQESVQVPEVAAPQALQPTPQVQPQVVATPPVQEAQVVEIQPEQQQAVDVNQSNAVTIGEINGGVVNIAPANDFTNQQILEGDYTISQISFRGMPNDDSCVGAVTDATKQGIKECRIGPSNVLVPDNGGNLDRPNATTANESGKATVLGICRNVQLDPENLPGHLTGFLKIRFLERDYWLMLLFPCGTSAN